MKTVRLVFAVSIVWIPISGLLVTSAHATTGFLKGQRAQGMSQICFYDVMGEAYTINIGAAELCPISYDFETRPPDPVINAPPAGGKTGFLKGERQQGMSKLCFYDVLGETYPINLGATDLCPLTFDF